MTSVIALYSEIAFIEISKMVIDDRRRKHSQQNPKELFLRTPSFDIQLAGFAAVCPKAPSRDRIAPVAIKL